MIAPLLADYNNRSFQKMPQSRNSLWNEVERKTLTPLPPLPYEPRVVVPSILVSPQCHVKCDSHKYSVPYRFCGKRVDLLYTALTVEMRYEGERIAFHMRKREPGITSIEEHEHPAQKWYMSLTAANALRWAGANGPYVLKCAQRIIERSVTEIQGCRSVMGILKLKDKYSQGRVDVACRLALRENQTSYQRVKAILERGLDKVFMETESMQQELPLHDNIRGASAYA